MYINDIADGIQSQLHLIADNCIIYRTIDTPEDRTTLQQDLNQLSKWATTWQMEFNISKCNILRISHLHTTSNHTYTMYETQLKVSGVWINENCHGKLTSCILVTKQIEHWDSYKEI